MFILDILTLFMDKMIFYIKKCNFGQLYDGLAKFGYAFFFDHSVETLQLQSYLAEISAVWQQFGGGVT